MATLPFLGGSLLAVVLLVGLSAFFSSSETAIFSLPAEWRPVDAAGSEGAAGSLADLRADPHRLLVTILVGNNVVNMAIASIVTVVVSTALPPGWAITVATIAASVIVLVFGEIVPKSYGLGNAQRWSLVVAGPLKLVGRLTYPVVITFDGLTRRMALALGGDQDLEETYLDD